MRIFKEGNKIIIQMLQTDVLFNNSEREDALIFIDASVKDDAQLILPIPNENLGLIMGLLDEEYKELSEMIMKKIKEFQTKRIENMHNMGGI